MVELERIAGKCSCGYGGEEGSGVGEGDAWLTGMIYAGCKDVAGVVVTDL
jgi:hypothetical protein